MEEEKRVFRNIDGEEVDLLKDDLAEKLTYESANLIRRLCAYAIDIIIIVAIWALATIPFYNSLNSFVEGLGLNDADFSDLMLLMEFRDRIWKFFMNVILLFIGIKTVYYLLVPAIVGDGRTIGKLLAGIGVVSIKDLNEASPSRLVLREVVGRMLLENILILPSLVSIGFAIFRDDSRSLRDLLAKTVVIRLDLYNVE